MRTKTAAQIEHVLSSCTRVGLEKSARSIVRETRKAEKERCDKLILERLTALLLEFKQESLF